MLTHLDESDALCLQKSNKQTKKQKCMNCLGYSTHMTKSIYLCVCVCVLPDDADIVLGFVNVAGGSGLLSMIVPMAQRPFTFLHNI